MVRRRARYIVPAVMVLLMVPAVFTQTVRKAIFVSAEQLDTAGILINPPAKNSDETKAELRSCTGCRKRGRPRKSSVRRLMSRKKISLSSGMFWENGSIAKACRARRCSRIMFATTQALS